MKKRDAKQLLKMILAVDSRVTAIALKLDVHPNTVCRWRDGHSTPHPGHLKKLERLADLAKSAAADTSKP